MGWKRSDPASDPHLAALLALRWTLHSVGRLRGAEIVEWSRRSMALVPEDDAVRLEAEAILGLGLGLMGRVPDGIAAYEDVLAPLTGDEGSTAGRVWMAKSWLQLVVDDLGGIPQTLAEVARDQLGGGSVRIAVWAHVWRSRALFLLGDWDDAAASAERAVSLLEETGHNLLRPLARWVAVSVPTGRGEWAAAEAHAERAVADRGDYELMIVAAALAAAEPAWARGDHEGVLGALAPVRAIQPRQGVDEPGFWPWQHLYADALVSVGRLGDAAEFLAPHEELATERKRRSSIARLARVRGRLEAAAGRMDAAEAAFRHGLDQFDPDQVNRVPLPFERALLELAYGQMLRRRGRRREATTQLDDARERFDALGARPYVERCDLELGGLGRIRARGSTREPGRLTRQELAVARRVVAGMSNRDIASDMAISVKTVQFHIGNVYSKLGVHTRVQLANRLRPGRDDDPVCGRELSSRPKSGQLEDDDRLDRRAGLRVVERGVDVVELVGLDELVEGEAPLLPQLHHGRDEHLRDRAALDDRLERPALHQRGDADVDGGCRSGAAAPTTASVPRMESAPAALLTTAGTPVVSRT